MTKSSVAVVDTLYIARPNPRVARPLSVGGHAVPDCHRTRGSEATSSRDCSTYTGAQHAAWRDSRPGFGAGCFGSKPSGDRARPKTVSHSSGPGGPSQWQSSNSPSQPSPSITSPAGAVSCNVALGITSQPSDQVSPQQALAINRGHLSIEALHYLLDCNYEEDRSRIRSRYPPEK